MGNQTTAFPPVVRESYTKLGPFEAKKRLESKLENLENQLKGEPDHETRQMIEREITLLTNLWYYAEEVREHQSDFLWKAARQVVNELRRAQAKFPDFNSPHEGYAIIKEELDELWDDVKANEPLAAAKEAVQVAAMALRFMLECGGTHG